MCFTWNVLNFQHLACKSALKIVCLTTWVCVCLVGDLPAASGHWDSIWFGLGKSHLFFLQENKPTPQKQGSLFSPFPSLHEDSGAAGSRD